MKGLEMFLQTFDAPASFLLDDYPNAVVAYSLRYLRSAYVGSPVIRVRRSSDNVQQDFTPEEITNGTLETFVGVGNGGFIKVWYDQSGNNNDATQSTTTLQPFICNNGVLELENTKPTIKFNATSPNFLEFSPVNLFSFHGVGKSGTAPFERFIDATFPLRSKFGFYDSTPDFFDWYNNGELYINNVNGLSPNPQIASNFQRLVVSYANTSTEIRGVRRISEISFSTRYWRGNMQEIICYNEANTPNRLDIQLNINDYYNIY